jgi:hypothetical protein
LLCEERRNLEVGVGTVGAAVKRYLTQAECATQFDVSLETILNWEQGK